MRCSSSQRPRSSFKISYDSYFISGSYIQLGRIAISLLVAHQTSKSSATIEPLGITFSPEDSLRLRKEMDNFVSETSVFPWEYLDTYTGELTDTSFSPNNPNLVNFQVSIAGLPLHTLNCLKLMKRIQNAGNEVQQLSPSFHSQPHLNIPTSVRSSGLTSSSPCAAEARALSVSSTESGQTTLNNGLVQLRIQDWVSPKVVS